MRVCEITAVGYCMHEMFIIIMQEIARGKMGIEAKGFNHPFQDINF